MREHDVARRQLLRLVGAGVFFGTVGSGGARGAPPGHYIVGTRSPAATRAARGRAQAVKRVLDFGDIGQAVVGRFPEQAVQALSKRADVRYVEPDGQMHAIAIDSGDGEVEWGVDRVDAEKVHASVTGSGVKVAVVDTGIDYDHPDLESNVEPSGADYTSGGWWNDYYSTDPQDWNDDNGHGTHCAGIIGAVDDGSGVVGVAPEVSLYAVKVLGANGSGYWSDIAAGIRWAADNGMDVASMSLGGGYSSTVGDACDYAERRGVLLVAAAGNEGPDTADSHYPGAFPQVVSVAATERRTDSSGTDYDSLASFSSTGSTVEIGAPGRSIYSTYRGGGYATMSGTSMACPHVSGAGALLIASGYDSRQARDRLTATAEWPVYDYDEGRNMTAEEIGHGLLDVEAAVGGSGGDTDPVVTTDPASGITTTSATLNGTLTDLGGADSAACGFEYREAGTSTWTPVAAGTRSSLGSFQATVSGLTDGVTCEYRAVATASDDDTATGSTETFTTTDDPVVVTTGSADFVGNTQATLYGSVDDLGGASYATAGFEYRQVGAGSWSSTATIGTTGGYSKTVYELTPGTDYEFRAVATADDGDSDVGETNTFTTTGAGGGGEDTTEPMVETVSASEAGSPNPKAEVTPTATVSDETGLASVRFQLLDGSALLAEDEVSASGTTDTVSGYLEAGSGRNKLNGRTLTVRAVAVDAAGNESLPGETTVTA